MAIKKHIQIYQWKGLKLIKEVDNFLADVIGIEPLSSGLLIYGID